LPAQGEGYSPNVAEVVFSDVRYDYFDDHGEAATTILKEEKIKSFRQ
jgi:hypothetical protein